MRFFLQSQRQLVIWQRKHSTIEIVDADVYSHNVLSKTFEKLGPHLRTLIISNSTLDDFTLLTILKCSPFLEELCMSEVVIEQKLPAINPISIVHLTSVKIHHTNWLVFRFLTRSQITSLLINNYLDEGDGTRKYLIGMLSNQYRLKELMLHGTSAKTLFRDSDLNDIWNQNLSKFHIRSGFGKNSDAVDTNIVNFLILNNETLRNVEISIPNCEQIAIFTLLNLGNITSLTLYVGRLPKDQIFHQTLVGVEPNYQLKRLKLSGFFSQSDFAKVILNKYPAIVHLELDDWSNVTSKSNTLKFVAKQFPQLQQLFIPEISGCGADDDQLKFTALKQLNVRYMRNIQNLINFIRQNSSIETLKIGLVPAGQISSICKLIDLTQVQNLSFGGNAKSLRMIFNLIQTNRPATLKTLELSLLTDKNYSNFSGTVRNSMKIHFPNSRCASDLNTKLDAFLQFV